MNIDGYIKKYGRAIVKVGNLGLMGKWRREYLLGRGAITQRGEKFSIATQKMFMPRRAGRMMEDKEVQVPAEYEMAMEDLKNYRITQGYEERSFDSLIDEME